MVIERAGCTWAAALACVRLCAGAGCPPGAGNVVTGCGHDVGAALVESFPRMDARALPVLAGVARFAFVGAAAACLAAWAEPAARRDARLMLSSGARAWAIACLPPQIPLLLGASLGAGLMSLHEIEASVIVQPPGRGALAQQILSYLHFARLEDMSSAGLWLVGGGTLAAIACTSLIALGARSGQRGRNS